MGRSAQMGQEQVCLKMTRLGMLLSCQISKPPRTIKIFGDNGSPKRLLSQDSFQQQQQLASCAPLLGLEGEKEEIGSLIKPSSFFPRLTRKGPINANHDGEICPAGYENCQPHRALQLLDDTCQIQKWPKGKKRKRNHKTNRQLIVPVLKNQ